MKTNCSFCGKEIEKQPNQIRKYKTHYCNNYCSSQSRKKLSVKYCFNCGKEIIKKSSTFNRSEKHYCSRECFYKVENASRKKRVNVNCSYCNNSFEKRPSELIGKKNVYCSVKCKDIHTGILQKRDKHPRWNNNLTDEKRVIKRKYDNYLIWREKVYQRDKYTCLLCNDNKGGNLVAHHVYNYSEHKQIQLNINNGVTLCKNCHKSFHDTYGYTKNNIEQLTIFFDKQANQLPNTLVTM